MVRKAARNCALSATDSSIRMPCGPRVDITSHTYNFCTTSYYVSQKHKRKVQQRPRACACPGQGIQLELFYGSSLFRVPGVSVNKGQLPSALYNLLRRPRKWPLRKWPLRVFITLLNILVTPLHTFLKWINLNVWKKDHQINAKNEAHIHPHITLDFFSYHTKIKCSKKCTSILCQWCAIAVPPFPPQPRDCHKPDSHTPTNTFPGFPWTYWRHCAV